MSTNNYLAIFLGNRTGARMQEWNNLSESERGARQQKGMTAWKAWMEKHGGSVVGQGGPLGKTKRVGPDGVADTSNAMSAFVVVQAESHEAAAKMFEGHPHFSIFPGEAVEIMPVLPIPGG